MITSLLVLASACILLMLGLVHLLYTFHGNLLFPRDDALRIRLEQVSPVLTNRTTMWKTWIGFNASHSLGAIFFGVMYGYLALMQGALLFDSVFLRGIGLLVLAAYCVLGKMYWFHGPFRWIVLATTLYAAALAGAMAVSTFL